MDFYLAMKGNQLLILTTTWITLQIKERSWTQDFLWGQRRGHRVWSTRRGTLVSGAVVLEELTRKGCKENFLGSWKCSIKFWLVVTVFKIHRTECFRSVNVIVLDWTSAKDKCCLLLYYYYNLSSHQQHCKLGGELNTAPRASAAPTSYGPFGPRFWWSVATQHTHDSDSLSGL